MTTRSNRFEDLELETMLLGRHLAPLRRPRSEDRRLERSGYTLLSRLRVQEPMSIGELSDALGLDVSTLNRQTAALTRSGYLERVPDPDGGMARKFRVTQAGVEQLESDRRAMPRDFAASWRTGRQLMWIGSWCCCVASTPTSNGWTGSPGRATDPSCRSIPTTRPGSALHRSVPLVGRVSGGGRVLVVGDVVAPRGVVVLPHGQVGHEVVGQGAVPVLLAGRGVDGVAGAMIDDPPPRVRRGRCLGDVEGLAEAWLCQAVRAHGVKRTVLTRSRDGPRRGR